MVCATPRPTEPVEKSTAENPANYRLVDPADAVAKATLGEDQRTVLLTLASPLPGEGKPHQHLTGAGLGQV